MSITVTVENDTIKLPVHLPDGTRLEFTLPEGGAEVQVTVPDRKVPLPDWLQRSVGTATTGLSTDEILRETRGED